MSSVCAEQRDQTIEAASDWCAAEAPCRRPAPGDPRGRSLRMVGPTAARRNPARAQRWGCAAAPPRARGGRVAGSRSPRAAGGGRGSTRGVTTALVNVEFGPSTVLGVGMVLGGLGLYQVRAMRPALSRDYDIMFSSIALLTGGILIFQGWRLDPLLLFGQILTTATAGAFAVEAIQLREGGAREGARGEPPSGDGFRLPPRDGPRFRDAYPAAGDAEARAYAEGGGRGDPGRPDAPPDPGPAPGYPWEEEAGGWDSGLPRRQATESIDDWE